MNVLVWLSVLNIPPSDAFSALQSNSANSRGTTWGMWNVNDDHPSRRLLRYLWS